MKKKPRAKTGYEAFNELVDVYVSSADQSILLQVYSNTAETFDIVEFQQAYVLVLVCVN